MRLAQRVDGVAVEIGDRLAHHLVGGAAVEFHVAGHRQRVGARLLERLADVDRLDQREIVGAGANELAELAQQAPALGRREASPGAGEGALGRRDRRVDVRRSAARDRADLRSAGGILERQDVSRRRGDPPAADEAFVDVEPDWHG